MSNAALFENQNNELNQAVIDAAFEDPIKENNRKYEDAGKTLMQLHEKAINTQDVSTLYRNLGLAYYLHFTNIKELDISDKLLNDFLCSSALWNSFVTAQLNRDEDGNLSPLAINAWFSFLDATAAHQYTTIAFINSHAKKWKGSQPLMSLPLMYAMDLYIHGSLKLCLDEQFKRFTSTKDSSSFLQPINPNRLTKSSRLSKEQLIVKPRIEDIQKKDKALQALRKTLHTPQAKKFSKLIPEVSKQYTIDSTRKSINTSFIEYYSCNPFLTQ